MHKSATTLTAAFVFVIAAGACKKNDEKAKPDPTTTEPTAASTIDAAPTAEDKKEPTDEEKRAKVAERLAEATKAADEEDARWTDELEESTKKLVEASHDSPKAALEAALAGEHRKPGNADRDAWRHPLETLEFFGLKTDMTVVEMGAGSGWYTEVLAPVLAKEGKLIAGTRSHEGDDTSMSIVYGTRQKRLLEKSSALFGKVSTFDVAQKPLKIGEPGSADLVVAIREMHNWQRREVIDDYLRAIVEVLKTGGRFGVVQHRAKEGAKAEESAENGYLPEAWVIETVEAAGLKLVEKSDINHNPKDTKDHPNGVWTLPPNLSVEEGQDTAKFEAIGESDRMTLLFEKPAE